MSDSSSWLLGCNGYCVDCGIENSANNAVGWAAQHARRSGHDVRVEVTRMVAFNARLGEVASASTGASGE
jgi:hypothetical protein